MVEASLDLAFPQAPRFEPGAAALALHRIKELKPASGGSTYHLDPLEQEEAAP